MAAHCDVAGVASVVDLVSSPSSPGDALLVDGALDPAAALVGTSLDSVETELDADSSQASVGVLSVGTSEGSASEASGPWAPGWVPACPPGLVTCPHCMTFVPLTRLCDYCLGELDDDVHEPVVPAPGAGSVVSSGASTVLPGSSETEVDSSLSDTDSDRVIAADAGAQ